MRRVLGAFGTLKLNPPKPGLQQRDPYRLRFAAIALLIGAFFVAGSDWSNRLLSSLAPRTFSGASVPTLDAWIDPPAYTGEAPLYLAKDASATAPQNSLVHLRVHNAGGRPRGSVDPAQDVIFTGQGGEYSATVKLAKSSALRVRADGLRIGAWQIKIAPDLPPVIAFANPPSKTPQNALKLSFTAGDDYGVVSARALITPVRAQGKTASRRPAADRHILENTFANRVPRSHRSSLCRA